MEHLGDSAYRYLTFIAFLRNSLNQLEQLRQMERMNSTCRTIGTTRKATIVRTCNLRAVPPSLLIAPLPAFRIGEVVNKRYTIHASHGKGVFSTVLMAKDNRSKDAEVAIKVIRNNDTMYDHVHSLAHSK